MRGIRKIMLVRKMTLLDRTNLELTGRVLKSVNSNCPNAEVKMSMDMDKCPLNIHIYSIVCLGGI